VAKTRRFGLPERVGWLRRNDVDSEMWPEESFGGVSDEQFWDDLSSDKPLANTARTAQPDTESRPRPARTGQSRLAPLPASTPTGSIPAGSIPAGSIPTGSAPIGGAAPAADRGADRSQSSTQAFPAVAAQASSSSATTQAFQIAGLQQSSGPRTGPQAAYTGPQAAHTGPQAAYTGTHTGPQAAYAGPHTGPQAAYTGTHTGPLPAYTGPQAAYTEPSYTEQSYTGPQPVQTGPLPTRSPSSRPAGQSPAYPRPQPFPQHVPPSQSPPPAQSLPPTQGLPALKAMPTAGPGTTGTGAQPVSRGRHSSGEDPLTSDKFSLRSAPDGRSYQAARRSRDLTREQYEAALSQETQTFSMTDGGSGAYPAQPRRRHADERPYGADGYGRDGAGTGGHPYPYNQQPGSQTPPYGENYDTDQGSRASRPNDARPNDARPNDARPNEPRMSEPRRAATHRDGYGRPTRPVYPDPRGQYDPRGGDRR
jgi:hypothetical protein